MIFFSEGFDNSYVDPVTGIPPGWSTAGGNGSNAVSATSARSGLQGIAVGGSSQGRFLQVNFPTRTSGIFSFALNVQAGFSSVCLGLADSSNGDQTELIITGSGVLQLWKGNAVTLMGTASITISVGAWHYYELKITINASTGSYDLHVDGVSVLSATGVNTVGTANANIAGAWIQGPANTPSFFDDIVFLDTTGAVNNDFLGDVSVLGKSATANGTENDFTQNANTWVAATVTIVGTQIVDANGNLQQAISVTGDAKTAAVTAPTWATTPVGATTTDNHVTWRLVAIAPLSNFSYINEPRQDIDSSYLTSATVNNQERYDFANTTAAKVMAVNVKAFMRKDDAGTRTARLVAKSGATTADNGTDLALTSNYQMLTAIFETDPNTSTAWTQTTLNAAEFGVKVTT